MKIRHFIVNFPDGLLVQDLTESPFLWCQMKFALVTLGEIENKTKKLAGC